MPGQFELVNILGVDFGQGAMALFAVCSAYRHPVTGFTVGSLKSLAVNGCWFAKLVAGF